MANSASVSAKDTPRHPYTIHTAFKCNLDTYFFKVPIQMNHLLEIRGELAKLDFKQSWNKTANTKVFPPVSAPVAMKNLDLFAKLLRENNMFVIQKKKDDEDIYQIYISCRAANGQLSYFCLVLNDDSLEVEVRSDDPEILDMLYQGLLFVSS